jgi:ATP-dependent HslUV protease ATP-binding subunit HslU
LKIEATKYTEVGYVGRDVESMIRDLMAVGFKDVKAEMEETLREKSVSIVEEKLLDLLLPGSNAKKEKKGAVLGNIFGKPEEPKQPEVSEEAQKEAENQNNSTREKFRTMLRDGLLEDREVELTIQRQRNAPSMEIIAGGSLEDLESGMQNIMSMLNGGKTKKRTVSIREARKILTEETLENMVDADKVAEIAKERVEQSGIIFIDEIDKIAVHGESHGQGVSREGVQRDILPIVEGSNVNTKYGVINTTHILFIAAGAFSVSAPSDLIPELQGRFPLRVELDSLHKEDFKKILQEPKNSLIGQYTALLSTEGVTLNFTEDAIDKMSFIAEDVNARAENIGARRLHTIMEKVLDEISYSADEHSGETINVDAKYVEERLNDIVQDQDLSRYIL